MKAIVKIIAHEYDERSYALQFVREGESEETPEPLPAIVCGYLSAKALADGFDVPLETRGESHPMLRQTA